MAKNVFQPIEIVDLTAQKVKVSAPVFIRDEPEPLDIYEGPTADDLRREAEAFKEAWEVEKTRLVQEARDEADLIRKDAEKTAFDEVKVKNGLSYPGQTPGGGGFRANSRRGGSGCRSYPGRSGSRSETG